MLTEPEISEMFDQISSTYDRTNRILSLGVDLYWRRQVVKALLSGKKQLRILDVATGTGDQILSLLSEESRIQHIVGVDVATEMLKLAREKLVKSPYSYKVTLKKASALEIPYPDGSFDAVTVSFGIRNMRDPAKALSEFYRALGHRGTLAILEFSLPSSAAVRIPYLFYLRKILPKWGSLLSHHTKAYSYLNETIEQFPSGEAFCRLLREAGFSQVRAQRLSLGIVTLYTGKKDEL